MPLSPIGKRGAGGRTERQHSTERPSRLRSRELPPNATDRLAIGPWGVISVPPPGAPRPGEQDEWSREAVGRPTRRPLTGRGSGLPRLLGDRRELGVARALGHDRQPRVVRWADRARLLVRVDSQ